MNPSDAIEAIEKPLSSLPYSLSRHILEHLRKLTRHEPVIGIMGKSGAGKSSLCNALFQGEVTPVSDVHAGTREVRRFRLRDSAKHRVSELPVNWWVQPSVIRTFSSRGDMSMGTAAAGSNMTLSPSQNGTSLDLQAGLEARVRENITLGVQAGYAHSVSGSSAEGYNGQATLNVTF